MGIANTHRLLQPVSTLYYSSRPFDNYLISHSRDASFLLQGLHISCIRVWSVRKVSPSNNSIFVQSCGGGTVIPGCISFLLAIYRSRQHMSCEVHLCRFASHCWLEARFMSISFFSSRLLMFLAEPGSIFPNLKFQVDGDSHDPQPRFVKSA